MPPPLRERQSPTGSSLSQNSIAKADTIATDYDTHYTNAPSLRERDSRLKAPHCHKTVLLRQTPLQQTTIPNILMSPPLRERQSPQGSPLPQNSPAKTDTIAADYDVQYTNAPPLRERQSPQSSPLSQNSPAKADTFATDYDVQYTNAPSPKRETVASRLPIVTKQSC